MKQHTKPDTTKIVQGNFLPTLKKKQISDLIS